MTEPSLLLLIPAYNEERRLEPVLREYGRYFQEHYPGKFQLVVVLNGCTDDTLGVVRRVAVEYPFITALEFKEAIGKGGALIEGLKLAPLADVIGYVDADGATPPRAFHDLVKRIGEADCVIGSRWLPGAVLHVEQSTRPPVGQPRFPFHRAKPVMDEHPRHPVRRESDAARGGRESPLVPAHRRHGVRHQPALLAEARRLPHPGGADRVDRQNRVESGAGPHVADDVPVRVAHPADLLAALPVAAPAAPAGSVGLQKASRPAAAAGTAVSSESLALRRRNRGFGLLIVKRKARADSEQQQIEDAEHLEDGSQTH